MALQAWLSSSLRRLFPVGKPQASRPLRLVAARGERISFQVGFVLSTADLAEVSITVNCDDLPAHARRVGSVPVPHHNTQTPRDELDGWGIIPGYVPDPLFPETSGRFAPYEVNAFWITVEIPADTKPGPHAIEVKLRQPEQELVSLQADVFVSEVVLSPRRDFRVMHWFYADAIHDWYKLQTWEEAFWPLCGQYMRDYAQHGSDGIYVPLFTPPTDGVKRPTQLLGVRQIAPGQYEFDWTLVERWIKLAQASGIQSWEWVHLFTQWGVRHAIRIYRGHGEDEQLLWPADTGATSDTYRGFLSQFLPQLQQFIQQHGLMEQSYFHLSDEPHGEEHLVNYRAARNLLRELAPWMKVMDAMSDIRYGQEGLTDIPIPSIQTALEFVKQGIPSWCYYCCGPRGHYLNRLLDSPLPKIRMNGWLFYRWKFGGFLHWGYNYWYKSQTRQLIDPFTVTDAHAWPGWAYGDTFVVYPGASGPIDSIRWEIYAESLQDYALLQTLGIDPDDPMLASLKSFEDFPKTQTWIAQTRRKLLTGPARRSRRAVP